MDKKITDEFTNNQIAIANIEGQIAEKVRSYYQELERLKQQSNLLREKLMVAMEKQDIKKFDNDFLSITYVAATSRVGVDVTKLKEEQPDIYKQYVKTSPVKASIRLKIKEN